MKCFCCQSNDVELPPFKLEGYLFCRNCGFLFKPGRASEVKRQQIARHYEFADPHEAVAKSKQTFFNFALNQLPDPKNKNLSLLDVGCGYGYFIQKAAHRGWQTTGVEIVEEAVRKSQKIAEFSNVYHGTLIKASFSSNSFDVITLWDVMVFVEDPVAELRECYRLLKGGGKIGIRLRNSTFQKILYFLYKPLQGIFTKWGMRKPFVFHQYSFSSDSIYYLLSRLGYRKIRIQNSPLTHGDPYGHAKQKNLVKSVKYLIEFVSMLFFRIGRGRWLIGPSLLVWAEKPGENTDR